MRALESEHRTPGTGIRTERPCVRSTVIAIVIAIHCLCLSLPPPFPLAYHSALGPLPPFQEIKANKYPVSLFFPIRKVLSSWSVLNWLIGSTQPLGNGLVLLTCINQIPLGYNFSHSTYSIYPLLLVVVVVVRPLNEKVQREEIYPSILCQTLVERPRFNYTRTLSSTRIHTF